MSWVRELIGRVNFPDGRMRAAWYVLRAESDAGKYWVWIFGPWGDRGHLKEWRSFVAVVNDFGDLVAVPS